MASIYSQQPKVYSNIKDFSNYDYCDESTSSGSSDDDSDYEKDIEYSLEQQDKIERIINDNGRIKPSLSKSQLQPILKSNSKSNLNKISSLKYNTSNGNLLNNIKPIFIDIEDEEVTLQQNKDIEIINNNGNSSGDNSNNNNNHNNNNNIQNYNSSNSFQTSQSVYNSIKSDSSLAGKVHEFIVCYEDRLGISEIPFKSFDSTTIPVYRIQSFKYKDQIIWNQKEKVYNINLIN